MFVCLCLKNSKLDSWSRCNEASSWQQMSNITIYQLHRFTTSSRPPNTYYRSSQSALAGQQTNICGKKRRSMDQMFPDEMGIGEEDKTVQLVLIYSAIAILYLVVAYIMFFRSFFSAVLPFSVWSTIVQEETQRGKRRPSQKGRRGKENGRTKERQENEKEGLNAQTSHLS